MALSHGYGAVPHLTAPGYTKRRARMFAIINNVQIFGTPEEIKALLDMMYPPRSETTTNTKQSKDEKQPEIEPGYRPYCRIQYPVFPYEIKTTTSFVVCGNGA